MVLKYNEAGLVGWLVFHQQLSYLADGSIFKETEAERRDHDFCLTILPPTRQSRERARGSNPRPPERKSIVLPTELPPPPPPPAMRGERGSDRQSKLGEREGNRGSTHREGERGSDRDRERGSERERERETQ